MPAWFSDRDRPWLRDLLDEVDALVGRPVSELSRRWNGRAPDPRAGRRFALARHVVLRAVRRRRRLVDLAALRRDLFVASARGVARSDALAAVSARHGMPAEALAAELFSDLAHARPITRPEPPLEPTRMILGLNRAIAQGMLMRAEVADLHLVGASRTVLRTAWLHGAWFTAVRTGPDQTLLRWRRERAGPRAARGLAAVVPILPWARRFELRARCEVHREVGTFVLTIHDAILPGPEPRPFDSALERRFARDLLAEAPEWDLLREPAPVVTDGRMAFPDFLLRRRATDASWLVEIAGLRDRSALPGKLAVLETVPRLCLCLPRALVPESCRAHPRVIPFGRSVDAGEVVRRLLQLDASACGGAACLDRHRSQPKSAGS